MHPPPLNNSILHDLEIIASQQDVRHVRISFVPNLTVHKFIHKLLGHLHGPTSLTTDDGALQAKYHTSSQARYIVQSLIHFCKHTFDPNKWSAIPTLLTKRPQKQRPSISTWMISIRNLPIPLLHDLSYLPGNTHTNPPLTTLAPQNEPLATKRTRFSTSTLWLHETNTPPNMTLNPPARPPTETAVTPTLDDYNTAFPDKDDGNAPTFVPPQTPHLSPHGQPLRHLHIASPQSPQATPPPLPAPTAHKQPTPDPHPLASPPPHATPQTTTLTLHNETPPNKRSCLYTPRHCLRETNRPSTPTSNPPTSPTAKSATPTFDDYVPSPAHDDVRFAQTPSVPPTPAFLTPRYAPPTIESCITTDTTSSITCPRRGHMLT